MSDMIVRREGGIKISRIKESDIDTHIKNNENKMNNLLSERILNSLKNYKVNMKTRNNILTYNRNINSRDKSIQKDKKETKNKKEKKHKIITLDFDSLDINDRYGNKVKEETVGGDYLFSDFYYSPESIYY